MFETVLRFFDDVQQAAESGGRQFGPDGKPLVGRYRDGSTPKPSKRAYGAGQMQVKTAQNTATAHGVPWDENRFYNDKSYNLGLADKHMRDLTEKYGDKTLARAAYHSGEPIVDAAIEKYGREGFAQGLGPEGRNYIKMGQAKSATPRILEQLDNTLRSKVAPETQSSHNVKQNSANTFGSDQELGRRADTVEGNLNQQGAQIDILNQVVEVAQQGARDAMSRQLEDTRAISNEIVEGTTELRKKVMPVFQARGRVADQLDKLNTMNPLERGIRGIFDLNYDQDYLEGQLEGYDKTLATRSADYQYLNTLHGVALQEIERRYKMDTSMSGLLKDQAVEDLGITGMRIQQSASLLGNLSDRIGTESKLIAAKAQAREDLMLRLDTPTITDLMTQAQEAGGVVQYNGVEFSYGELRDRVQASEQQELAIESNRMAIAGGRMDLAEKYAVNIAQSLTRGQLEGAIQNGGIYNGIQLPQDVLTNLYQSAISRDSSRATEIANNMPSSVALRTGADYLKQSMGLYSRGKGLFGNQAMEGSSTYLDRGTMLVNRLVEATKNKEPPEVLTALTQQIAANSAGLNTFVSERILRSVGGDKRAAGYLQGFVYGTELSQGTAAEAMTYFALKGNLPAGLQLTPEARQVFGKAQTLVEAHRGDRVGGKAISESQLQAIVTRELTESAPKIMGQARHDKLFAALPSVAKQTQHPFGKFDEQRWGEIRSEAAATGAESVAHDLNTTPQNVLQMLRTGKSLTNDEPGKQLLAKTQAAASKYNAVEMQTMVRLVDGEPSIQPGTRNSTVMSHFIGSPQFSNGISTYGQALGQQSMGEYLTNPMTAGATERNFVETRQSILDGQSMIHQTERQLAQNPASNMMFKPMSRTKTILQAIPGVGKPGASKLAPFVSDFYKKYTADTGFPGIEAPNTRFRREDGAMLGALQATKFEDPTMESYRKQAVKGWEEHATAQQGFIERFLDGLFGDEPSIPESEVMPGAR